MSLYETDRLLSEYLLFHYGTREELLPWDFGPTGAWNFPARAADRVKGGGGGRALDLGCAVGRAAFELSTSYGEVIGIDRSQRFIGAARQLQAAGELAYERADEGDCTTPLVARVSSQARRERVRFEVGDAMDLPGTLGHFDLVLAANLLCRLPEPRRLLERFSELVTPGGRLAITTPMTWMEEYTPRVHWLGGTEQGGVCRNTLESIREALGEAFALEERDDLPFLIREHARKYQWSVAELSVWRRR